MLVRRTRSDPARPTGASPGARPPRPRSNRESGSNEPEVRADTVRPTPRRPHCLRAEPGPSGLPTMQGSSHNLPAFPRAPHMYRRQIGRKRGGTCHPVRAHPVRSEQHRGARGACHRWRAPQHRARHSELVIFFEPAAASSPSRTTRESLGSCQSPDSLLPGGRPTLTPAGPSSMAMIRCPLRPRAILGRGARRGGRRCHGSDGRFSAVTASGHAGCPISGAGGVYTGEWITQAGRDVAGRKPRWTAI